MPLHAELITDDSGSTGIALYEVPDAFDALAVYSTFCAGFVAAHPTKSGKLTTRQRDTQSRQWLKYLDKAFKRVRHTTR